MSRDRRRSEREKKIRSRVAAWRAYYGNKSPRTPGTLAKHSALRCPDGRACFMCHGEKVYGGAARRQAEGKELADMIADGDA